LNNNMNEAKTKVCSKCNQELPATSDYFYKQKGGKYGLRGMCIDCKKKQDKQYAERNRDALIKKWREYNQQNREVINEKNREYYKANADQIRQQRKEQRERMPKIKKVKQSRKMKRYYEANKEKLKEYARSYRKTDHGRLIELKAKHRRKARERDLPATFTEKEWEECKKHFDYKCAYCEKSPKVLHQEHFIPVSKDGEYTKQNIVPSCQECNFRKHNLSFGDWYPNYKYYSKEREEKILAYLGYENLYQQISIL